MFIPKQKPILPILLIIATLMTGGLSLAKTKPQADPTASAAATSAAEKLKLQQQLTEIESQIAAYQQQLKQVTGQKNTLQNKINLLKKQQATLNLQVQATNLQIAALTDQISETQNMIDDNTLHIERLKLQVSDLIRATNEADDYSLLYLLLSQDNLSDALTEVETFSQISENLHSLMEETVKTNDQLASLKEEYSQEQDDNNNLLTIQALQKQQLLNSVSEQNTILSQTKGVEANYQQVLSNTQKQAAEIRGRLYQLLGISTQITFGQAVEIAQWASGQTGVRAAFLLAILTQESNLGKNVGTCNRPGDGPEKSWRVVMKPERDQAPFVAITQELGMDTDTTPVSCPMHDAAGKQLGWGGAMGPAQFIPSTWMGYKDQVRAVTGRTANPWDIRDAFLASAIKLKAGGAGTVSGEWAAAMRYFSGGTNPRYSFYGDNVVATANKYQADIDNLAK